MESEGWEVHTDIKECCTLDSPLPETEDAGREEEFLKQVKALEGADQKRALILKISHIGGHKYAGKLLSCETGPTLTARLCRERHREFIWNVQRTRSDAHLMEPQIYTPQGPGSGVWYGRVTPHEVEAVVRHTIIEGKVLPPLFRGGVNLSRATGKTLLDW